MSECAPKRLLIERWSDIFPIGLFVVGLFMSGCMSVDTLLLTSKTFPPKASLKEVAILDREPSCEHIAIAQLSVEDGASDSYRTEQDKILEKAASLGSDAVVFSKPEKHVEHGVDYQGSMMIGGPWGMGNYGYPGWGYGMGMGYGLGGMGYGGGMAVPYDYTVTSLTGIAIRYTNRDHPNC